MFASPTRTATPSFGQRAARTARLLKAFATLDDRPLDASGRPVAYEPEPWLSPRHDRRPGVPTARETHCSAPVPSLADVFCEGR